MRKKHLFALIFFIFAFVVNSKTTNEEGLSVLKTPDGFLFVFNGKDESFKCEIMGKKFFEIEPEDLLFSIDGQLIQFTIVPVGEFLKSHNSDTLFEHFIYERDYLRTVFPAHLVPNKPKVIDFGNRTVFLWEVEPKIAKNLTSTEKVYKHIYATTNTNRYVILLSSPLTKANNELDCRKRLIYSLKGLTTSFTLYDLEAIRDSLQNIGK